VILQRIGNRGIQLGTLFERAAAKHPANLVILDHDLDIAPELGRRATVTELADLIDDVAARLWAAQVRPGDRVVVHKADNFDIPLLACAIARIGAVPVLLSPKLDGETVVALIGKLDQPFLMTDEAKLDNSLPDTVFDVSRNVLLASGSYPGTTRLDELAGAERVASVHVPARAPTLVTHTSGTTGMPKLAVHTGRSFQARYRPQASVVSLVSRREPLAIHVSFAHSRLFTALPIGLLQGHPLIILRDDDPEKVAETFAQVPPGIIEAHPNTFLRWEELVGDPRNPLGNVKYFSSTFDAIHPRTVSRLLSASRRRSPQFVQMYGQSEVGPIAGRTYNKKRGMENGRCVGFTFPGMTAVRVVSRNGNPPSQSSPGDIEVRSDGRIVTYHGEHARWEKQVDDGWWRMGDVGYKTRWGCLHLLDRAVDVIPGIESTLAIEDALFARMESLVEVIIVANKDQVAVPVICTKDDLPLDRAEWRTAVVGLPTMADPVQWKLADLPHTATTKIKRLELARLLNTTDDGAAA
jgi:acyl-coenzyme A synthetase/AMP-(fatty) acid ligase